MDMRRRLLIPGAFLAFLLVLTGGVAEGLRCYQCGTFLATTSVSPCLNFTGGHLKECPHAFCSKYVGLSATVIVYGCEPNCQEKQHGSFYSYCCTEDSCNHSPPSSARVTLPVLVACSVLAVSRVITIVARDAILN